MRLSWLVPVALLCAGCSADRDSSDTAAATVAAILASEAASAARNIQEVHRSLDLAEFEHVTKEEARQALREMAERRSSYLRHFAADGYFRRYPPQVRHLIRREMAEQALCRGGGNEATMTVCNNAYYMRLKLAHLGWCMAGDSEAERHWVTCEDDPFRFPDSAPPFEGEELVS